ncbi:uncharacterized protein ACLA_068840 [Aspergillus clavatus NRRL 1]|uniref:Uncharacterized protein n=1 Tax=Aspergillus clavatus (strain ATCC 1007 / CBS 513.65 / DSM 816 / NCTC 3887 / NRRL 1 / QM 1276 / 107) TaxID=344612 RepID=A1C635_ASPCL|nr:uncharacterized protein ACLA_068840 [Aspergillus clavatus NRRL 1]EAW13856.1 conserved hypothetical protein [Aspergillus clavatus NRRL 1]
MSSSQRRSRSILDWTRDYALIAILVPQVAAAGKSDVATVKAGYSYGQPMPVTCLNRTIDSGEHITDNLGKLQFIPFPTCNETFLPLALRYGVTETLNCTINALPDELYHLFEYYVHSDVPLACRVPTAPLSLSPSTLPPSPDKDNAGATDLDDGGPAYTPITFALQGTLQRSHLHIWTDMNVLVHNIASTSAASKKSKNKSKAKKARPGYVVAGTAYSIPEFDGPLNTEDKQSDADADADAQAAVAVAEAARDPWTAGHGTKVVRGEPLTFTLHVSWVEGGKGIWWPTDEPAAGEQAGTTSFVSRIFFFAMAAALGAAGALYWERNAARRRAGWRGDGILGGSASRGKGSVEIGYGNGGKINGYGGYSAAGNGAMAAGGGGGSGGYGYTGVGKRD